MAAIVHWALLWEIIYVIFYMYLSPTHSFPLAVGSLCLQLGRRLVWNSNILKWLWMRSGWVLTLCLTNRFLWSWCRLYPVWTGADSAWLWIVGKSGKHFLSCARSLTSDSFRPWGKQLLSGVLNMTMGRKKMWGMKFWGAVPNGSDLSRPSAPWFAGDHVGFACLDVTNLSAWAAAATSELSKSVG